MLLFVDTEQYNHLKTSLENLKLNDAALQFEVEKFLFPWASDSVADFWACCTWT